MKSVLTITNRTNNVRPLWIEPEGADFWMAPDQTFELHVEAATEGRCFEIWDNGDSFQVFPSTATSGYISVFCGGQELECGHSRPEESSTIAQRGDDDCLSSCGN